MAGDARAHSGSRTPAERPGFALARADCERLLAQRAYVSWRDVENLSPRRPCPRDDSRPARRRGRAAPSVAARVGIRARHLSVQGARFARTAPLSLAEKLLTERRARPDPGLEGGQL